MGDHSIDPPKDDPDTILSSPRFDGPYGYRREMLPPKPSAVVIDLNSRRKRTDG